MLEGWVEYVAFLRRRELKGEWFRLCCFGFVVLVGGGNERDYLMPYAMRGGRGKSFSFLEFPGE